MAKFSERQLLWLTIGASVALSGGVAALVFLDRGTIRETEEEITSLEGRIRLADVEIARTKEREDKVIVFREVEPKELEILPRRQQIADFHANMTTFLTQAGARVTKIPESTPKESELAKGIFVTANTIECEADAGALLRLVNMIEVDQRLVSVKGLKVKSGGRRAKAGNGPTVHQATLHLETYYYEPPSSNRAPIAIAGYESRLEDAGVRQAISSFQPEQRDNYALRPSASRRDPFVDFRKEVIVEDPEEVRRRFASEEGISISLEKLGDTILEKSESERAAIALGDLFLADQISREVDKQLNEARAQLAAVETSKSVTFPDLLGRVERVRQRVDAASIGRKDLPRELTVTEKTAELVRNQMTAAFARADYAAISSLSSSWEQFVRGKTVDGAAEGVLKEIADYRRRAKTLGEFHAKGVYVTGTVVTPATPATSVALVNGRALHIGEAVDPKGEVVVASIQRDAVEFRYREESILMKREDAAAADRVRGTKAAGTTPDVPLTLRPGSGR